MAGQPDPKPVRPRGGRPNAPRRVVDADALKRARLRAGGCVVCGRAGANVDHVVAKGAPHFGDDVDENLILLCGSGADGHHGAKHGIPWTDGARRRWTPEQVRGLIGVYLFHRRPDVISYVLRKLGDDAGRDWLDRRYGLALPSFYRPKFPA